MEQPPPTQQAQPTPPPPPTQQQQPPPPPSAQAAAQPPPPQSATLLASAPVPRQGPVPMPIPQTGQAPDIAPLAPPVPFPQGQRPDAAAPRRAAPGAPGLGALEGDSLHAFMLRMDRHGQLFLDRVAPYKMYRWGGLVVLLLVFMLRMYMLEGFYIVTYVLFIFILNQFILFLQPKDRAALLRKAAAATTGASEEAAESADQGALPMSVDDEEFRPFVRRLPEFKFWYSTTYATVLAFCATFFKAFDVPVFWPLLLFYFVLLFVATMRRQWLDMKRLKYVPWDIGSKKVYKSDPKRVSVSVNRANGPAPGAAAINSTGRAAPPVPTVQLQPKARPASPAPETADLR